MTPTRPRTRFAGIALAAVLSLLLASCGGDGGAAGANAGDVGEPQAGGELTVLLSAEFSGSWPTGLDPATNATGGGNISQMNAIFGSLMRIAADENGENARIEGRLATDWAISEDGKTITINLREGVEFSDGTPFNAEAVAAHFERAVTSPCTCAPQWPVTEADPFTTPDDRTVEVHLTQPNAAFIHQLAVSNANWVPSPTALAEMGEEQFKQKPVGAGPFKVVSNQISSKLVLERNESYWEEGRPYLDGLTFQAIGGDQPAYQALLAGQADAYEGMNTTPLIQQAEESGRLQVIQQPPTSPYVVQLNTTKPPFDDQRAREAIYYATNVEAINEGLFDGQYPISQMFTGEGGLFHHAEVPGYRTHDLAKAKALVQELGGLQISLGTISNYVAEQVNAALQSQWQEAGIEVTLENHQLSALIKEFETDSWQAMLQTSGSWDPHAGIGVPPRFLSTSLLSGVTDPELDELLNQAAAATDPEERDRLYLEAGTLISDKAYAPFLFAFAPVNLAVQGAHGPGLTTKIPPSLVNSAIHWEAVWASTQ